MLGLSRNRFKTLCGFNKEVAVIFTLKIKHPILGETLFIASSPLFRQILTQRQKYLVFYVKQASRP